MNNSNNNNNNNNPSGDVMSWVIVIICLVAFWPLGLVLLLKKISSYNNSKTGTSPFSNFKPGQAPFTQNKQYSQPQQPNQAGQAQQTASQAQPAPAPSPQQPSKPYQATPYYKAQKTPQMSYTPFRVPEPPRAPKAPQYNYYANAVQNAQAWQKPPAGKKIKKVKEKKQGSGLAAFLTFLGVVFSAVGISFVLAGLSAVVTGGLAGAALGTFLIGAFFCLGGIISFLSRINIMGRIRRVTKYSAILGGREVISVADMAKSAGVSPNKLRKELIEMADSGYFGDLAYFDSGLDSLCLSSDAAEKARSVAGDAAAAAAENVGSDNQYVTIINELHLLCSRTSDPSICSKIERIEEITAKIFKIVEDKPEKAPQIRRFMNYYLPTTLKLLHSYETLEKQGIEGENIMSAKQDIERVLETLTAGFEQQLDNLFKADKIDISADINVLENMMEQDGLTNDGNILKTAGGN